VGVSIRSGLEWTSADFRLFLLYGKNGGRKHKIRFRVDMRRF
jgi:hypothetical protein